MANNTRLRTSPTSDINSDFVRFAIAKLCGEIELFLKFVGKRVGPVHSVGILFLVKVRPSV